MQPAAHRSMQPSWCLLQKGNVDDTQHKLTLITMYIPVESVKPFFRLMSSGRNFLSRFAMQTLLPSKASTRVRTQDTPSRQGDALVRTLHVLVSSHLARFSWLLSAFTHSLARCLGGLQQQLSAAGGLSAGN